MPFLIHRTNHFTNSEDSITIENYNSMLPLFHIVYIQTKMDSLYYPRYKNDKVEKVTSLLKLFSESLFFNYGNCSVFDIYDTLLEKFGYKTLKDEFPDERFNGEFIDAVETNVQGMIGDAFANMPIDYPEDNSIDLQNENYFDGMSQDELDAFRDNAE